MTPTAAQWRLLVKLRDCEALGQKVYATDLRRAFGRSWSYVVDSCIGRGWVAWESPRAKAFRYWITDAGRAALATPAGATE